MALEAASPAADAAATSGAAVAAKQWILRLNPLTLFDATPKEGGLRGGEWASASGSRMGVGARLLFVTTARKRTHGLLPREAARSTNGQDTNNEHQKEHLIALLMVHG
ncbi:hypothetical protein I4F81_012257 [Pyropia yezoensis]|uniref:Uncharacterized protein n=1 Tax=Pyropia yezoensis TaxID=2788 RepID=A0ACC3CHP2_PYRYE|nr:hypothetical protein I4F81_012257 [Neopyropia yezoensis]